MLRWALSIDIKDVLIGTDFNAVGGPQIRLKQRDCAIRANAPDLPLRFRPIRVASVDNIVRTDSDIIWLIHGWFVSVNADLLCRHVNQEDIMVGIVSDEHGTRAVETDAVPDAAVGQLDKDATFSGRCDLSDRVLAGVVDGVEIALGVASGGLQYQR